MGHVRQRILAVVPNGRAGNITTVETLDAGVVLVGVILVVVHVVVDVVVVVVAVEAGVEAAAVEEVVEEEGGGKSQYPLSLS